ncbi:MAG: hypothetical protein ACHQQQ_06285 [Bacteroidota bacterium]
MFYLYKCNKEPKKTILTQNSNAVVFGKRFKEIWEDHNSPEKYWSFKASEIISKNVAKNSGSLQLLSNYKPDAKGDIYLFLIELLDFYVYTYKKGQDHDWSVVLIKFREIMNESKKPLSKQDRDKAIKKIENPLYLSGVEFIYLRDDWNCGRNGSVNAAMIYLEALKYFQPVLKEISDGKA